MQIDFFCHVSLLFCDIFELLLPKFRILLLLDSISFFSDNLKLIFMKQRNTLLTCCFLFIASYIFGQGQLIKGTVLDEQGATLTGATVLVKGTVNGTISDIDGNFSIKTKNESDVLLIKYLGYITKEINPKGNRVLKVVLESNYKNLDEVQIVGYGQQSKISITGAVSSIGTAELIRSPAPNIGNILAGNMSGVSSVQFSGQPGADNPEIYVRGISTLKASNSTPLILVDGVERDFFNLDPNEVETISVLKDASATAVFGVRGANGVIIVTTRRGQEGPARISASTSFGVQQATRLPEFANSYEWATYANEARYNDDPTKGLFQTFSQEAVNAFQTHSNPIIYPDTDWMDMLFKKNASQSQHNINISGGTKRVRYFTSLSYLTQDGMFINHDKRYNGNFYFNRLNFRTNLDVDFSKSTIMSINLGGRNEVRNEPNSASTNNEELFRWIYRAAPFSGAGIVDGKWIRRNTTYMTVGPDNDGLVDFYGKGYRNKNKNILNIDIQLAQKLDIVTKGLSAKIKGSYNADFEQTKSRSAAIASYRPYYMKDLKYLTPIPGEEETIVYLKSGDEGTLGYSESTGRARNYYLEGSLNYDRKFGDHAVTGLLLYNNSHNYYPSSHPEIARAYVGMVGRVTYNYKTKYLVDVNAGYNGSENFHEERRFGFFPSISAGWVLTSEQFMANQNVLNYMKIRASFGVVGNDKDDSNRFLYLPGEYVNSSGYYFGTNVNQLKPGKREAKLGNELLTWEKAYKQNYGVDFAVFDSKLNVNIDVFSEYRKDILTPRDATNPSYYGMGILPGFGTTLPTLNLGIVRNEGCEMTLKWKDKITKDFSYNLNLNISYARNTILDIDEPLTPFDYQWRTGRSVGQAYGKKFIGFYYEGMPNVAEHSSQLYPGDCVYADLSGDGKIDGDDDMAIGNPNYPLLNGGITLGFTYKNLTYSMLFVGATLTSRVLEASFKMPGGDTYLERSMFRTAYTNRWTPETAATATEPRPSYLSVANNYREASDLWVRDASYLRLKNVEVSYNVKMNFMKTLGITGLRLFVNAYNLFTLDKLKIIDPETRTSDRPTYPAMRIMNMGANINF